MKEKLIHNCQYCKMQRDFKKDFAYTGFYEFIVWFCFICLKEAYFFQGPINHLFLVPPILFSINKRFFKVWICSVCHSEHENHSSAVVSQ